MNGNICRGGCENYSVLFRPELLDSFQENLHNCSEVANDKTKVPVICLFVVFFCSVLLLDVASFLNIAVLTSSYLFVNFLMVFA